MKTVDETVSALQARIRQLAGSINALEKANGPALSRVILESVKEELETLRLWILEVED